jgi:hypothetical protein
MPGNTKAAERLVELARRQSPPDPTHLVERLPNDAGALFFGIADDAGFVNLKARESRISDGRLKSLFDANTFRAPLGLSRRRNGPTIETHRSNGAH